VRLWANIPLTLKDRPVKLARTSESRPASAIVEHCVIRQWKFEEVQAVEGQVPQVGNRQTTIVEIKKVRFELPSTGLDMNFT